MNKQITEMTGITLKDYVAWCKENKKPMHSNLTKKKFYKDVLFGKLAKNEVTGKIERKKIK